MTDDRGGDILISRDSQLARDSSDIVRRGLDLAISLAASKELKQCDRSDRQVNIPQSSDPIWKCLYTFAGDCQPVKSVALTSDGQIIAMVDRRGTIIVWDLSEGEVVHRLDCSDRQRFEAGIVDEVYQLYRKLDENYRLLISSDDRNLLGISDRQIKIWDLQTGELRQVFDTQHCQIERIYCQDDRLLAVTAEVFLEWNDNSAEDRYAEEYWLYKSAIKVWNLERGKLLHCLNEYIYKFDLTSQSFDSPAIVISPDGQFLVSADNWTIDEETYSYKIWDLHREKLLYFLPEPLELQPFEIGSDGKLITCSSNEYTIRVWDIKNCQLLYSLKGHSDSINAFDLSKDDRTLVSGSNDRKINVWNLKTGELQQSLCGHLYPINSVQFSANGKIIASRDTENIIKIWGLASPDELAKEKTIEFGKQNW